MLDIGWPELLLIGVITVLVVGPKELPRVLRTTTQMVRKVRGLATEFQSGMNDLAKQADLEELKNDMKAVENDTAGRLNVHEYDSMLDPDNSIAGMFTGRPIRTPTPGEVEKKRKEREEAAAAAREARDAAAADAAAAKPAPAPQETASSTAPAQPAAAATPPAKPAAPTSGESSGADSSSGPPAPEKRRAEA